MILEGHGEKFFGNGLVVSLEVMMEKYVLLGEMTSNSDLFNFIY